MENSCRHFMTVLGTGDYFECVYETEDGKIADKTPFVQMAVLNYVMPQYQEGDRITVFVTDRAKEKNWVDTPKKVESQKHKTPINDKRFRRKIRLGKKVYRIQLQIASQKCTSAKKELSKEKTKRGLEFLLRQKFPDADIKAVPIPEGRNKQELDEIFENIYQELSDKETVYFDFTHGLRNLPMQALAVVNYAKVLKNIKVEGLYYGAFELGKNDEAGVRHVPILDMLSCSTIQDWTSAAETFVKAGSGNQIYDLYLNRKEWIDVDEECGSILESLHNLTNCLETSRGELKLPNNEVDRDKKSIDCAFKSFQENYRKFGRKGLPTSEIPLKRLFEYIYNDIKPFEQMIYTERNGKKMEYTSMGMSVVQWAIKKNLIQQGFTALNETIISYACELYGISANNAKKRNIVHDTIRGLQFDGKGPKAKRRNWKWETKYPMEIRKCWPEKWEKEHEDVEKDIAEKIKKMLVELPEKVIYLSNQVSMDRNTMNHFGVLNGKERASYETLKEHLMDRYSKMQKILEETHEVIQ